MIAGYRNARGEGAMRIANLMMLATASMIALGLAGCGEKTTPTAKQEAAKLTPEQEFAANLKKAEAGDAAAQKEVGVAYFHGKGITKDLAKYVEWTIKAAEQGDLAAQRNISITYFNGVGLPKNLSKAIEWMQKAAAGGDASAQVILGAAYRDGEHVPKDIAKAIDLFEKAAAQGDVEAQTALGFAYNYGEGVPKDMIKAIEWYEKAASQGAAVAQTILGEIYQSGEGVPKHLVKAKEWFEKAAEQGNGDSQHSLAMMYYRGEGVPKDGVKAVELWQKAAAQGLAKAQGNLGWAYRTGNGISEDLVLAYAWSNLGASQGSEGVVKNRDLFESQLSPAEKSEAQRLSSNWKKGQLLVRENQPAGSTAKTPVTSGNLTKTGTGTAFIVGKAGEAITNLHVIDGCKEVRAEGREGVVKVTTSDAVNDLSLIQLPGAVSATASITSDPAKLRQGEDIIAFGFPLNAVLSSGGNLTPGVVSALTGLGNNTNQIQITAPIQPGSSGSPVLNKKGEVVGVVSMKLSDTKMVKATGSVGQNVNFAVSGQTLKSFLDTHKVDYRKGGFMSFEKSTADLADEARKWTTVVECWR